VTGIAGVSHCLRQVGWSDEEDVNSVHLQDFIEVVNCLLFLYQDH